MRLGRRQIRSQTDHLYAGKNNRWLCDIHFLDVGRAYAGNHGRLVAHEIIRQRVRRIGGIVPVKAVGALERRIGAHPVESPRREREVVKSVSPAEHHGPRGSAPRQSKASC